MSDKKREYFSGKSLQQAIMAAACEYELAPEEVAYRKIDKRHGFLKSRKKVLIAVDPASPKREGGPVPLEAEASSPRLPRAPRPPKPAAPQKPAQPPKPAQEQRPARPAEASGPIGQEKLEERVQARGNPERGDRERGDRERGGRGDRGGRSRASSRESAERGPRRGPESGRGEARGNGRRGGFRGGPKAETTGGRSPAKGGHRGPGGRRGGRPGFEAPVDPVAEEQAAHARRMMELERAEAEAARRRERQRGTAPEPAGQREAIDHQIPSDAHPAEEAMAYLLAVTGLEVGAEVEVDGEQVSVEIVGPDAEFLLEPDGKPLSALEHLLPKVIRGISGEKLYCHVDTLGFREQRQRELEELARELADEVRDTGDSRTLEPLNPAERRIVHMTLAEDPDVETESKGGGYLKRLTIWPA